MKKLGFPQPDGTIPFEVRKSDTLVSIAAHCDISVGHLKKINRLMSENIFAGQVLYVPGPDYVPSNFITPSSSTDKSPSDHDSSAPFASKTSEKPRSSDGSLQFELGTSPKKSVPGHVERQTVSAAEKVTLPRALSEDEVKKIDEECHQRFVKMDAKYVEPGDEEVPGVLLVTPDTFFFDADESHPLVCRNGRDEYQFETSILNITLVTIYHGTTTSKFDRCPNNKPDVTVQSDAKDSGDSCLRGLNQNLLGRQIEGDSSSSSSSQNATLQHLEVSTTDSVNTELSLVKNDEARVSKDEDYASLDVGDAVSSRVEKESSDGVGNIDLKLSVTDGQTNNILKRGDELSHETAVLSTCDKREVSNQINTEKSALTKTKDTVAEDEDSFDIENNGSVLLNTADEVRPPSEEITSSLCQLSGKSVYPEKSKLVASADLETPITVFLCVKVDRSIEAIKGLYSDSPPTSGVRGPMKSEYWYNIPCDKADLLYAFFAQWLTEDGTKGFVVTATDSAVDYKKYSTADGQKIVCKIVKDWELWSAAEYRRMQSEEEIKQLPLPELSESSSIMETSHIAVLIYHLPAIAEGSPWSLVYSTSKHGFSLNTLYRKMISVDSPVFLIIQDVNDQVFGALISCTLKMSEHFYGSGESYLFTFYPEFKKFGWTGMNSFFVKGNKDSLAIGAGKGSNGLWLDGNLYHGRTQRCQTFENELLTISQDFTIKCLEAWCFV